MLPFAVAPPPPRTIWAVGRALAPVALLALLLSAAVCRAQDDAHDPAPRPASKAAPAPALDAETLRRPLAWPPDRFFDILHTRLEITIPDMAVPQLTAIATISAKAVGGPRSALTLDAGEGLTISSISVGAVPVQFTHQNEKLRVLLPAPVPEGDRIELRIAYAGKDMARNNAGLLWLPAKKDDDGREKTPALIYSQGQADWNRLWFPCHDFPHERLTTELIVTVPDGNKVLSNGRLLSEAPAGPGLTRFHWLQDKPHSTYLVTLVVGKFDIVELGGLASDRPGLLMPLYCAPGTGDRLGPTFKSTPAMVKFLEAYFDEPYPWDKYAQVIVRDFRWGGMENTSATTLADKDIKEGPGESDDLIVHELCHQWTGDLLTCRSWDHLWLNEGWATFSEWLWEEHQHGRNAYLDRVQAALAEHAGKSRLPAPVAVPIVSNEYRLADDVFEKPDNPYGKGGLILHMLRERLGDELFQTAVRRYIKQFRFDVVETDDFRRVLEETSGLSLERFFSQWALRPGLPKLAVDLGWDEVGKLLTVTIEQTQKIDADNPAYALRVPVWFEMPGEADGRWVYLDTDRRLASQTFSLPAKPTKTLIDPHLTNAATSKIRTKLKSADGEGN